jgi:hypothetical protein
MRFRLAYDEGLLCSRCRHEQDERRSRLGTRCQPVLHLPRRRRHAAARAWRQPTTTSAAAAPVATAAS